MSDPTPPPSNPTPPQAPPAPLTMHGQYIKDLSFENPRAPQSLIEQKQPQLTLNVTVNTKQFDPRTFEVALTIEASAQTPEKEPLFVLELIYAGTVSLGEVPQEAVGPLLFIFVTSFMSWELVSMAPPRFVWLGKPIYDAHEGILQEYRY